MHFYSLYFFFFIVYFESFKDNNEAVTNKSSPCQPHVRVIYVLMKKEPHKEETEPS